MNGMGGDLFAIYYDAKTGKLYGLNSSGWSPKALTIDYLKSHHIDRIDPIGVTRIDMPGCGRRMASAEGSIWHDALQQNVSARDLLRAERISFGRAQRALLGQQKRYAAARISETYLPGRRGTEAWRHVSKPGAG